MFKGFFNRMYNGNPNRPDLDPGDMPKNRFELFFTTLGVRFGDLIKLNLLLVVFMAPVLIWTALSFTALNNVDPNMPVADTTNQMLSVLLTYLIGNLILLPLAGPPLAGMTYVVRNYARDEHAWLWSDFKEHMKKNWKQSSVMMLLAALVSLVSVYTIMTYIEAMKSQDWMWVMMVLFIVFVGIFFLSFMYAFPMLVTYKLKLGQVIRNSLMLALGRLPFTIIFGFIALFPFVLALIIMAGFGLADGAVFSYTILGLVVYYVLIGFTLAAFITNSYTNATFDKLMKSDDDPRRPPVDPEDMDREVKP